MKNPRQVVSDLDLRDAVEEELSWEPRVDAARIRVSAEDGAVVLSGSVDSYSQKPAAVEAAERVRGVNAVADELEVVAPDSVKRRDAEIAAQIARRRAVNNLIPESVVVEVAKGKVTLRGDVVSSFAREEAERTVLRVDGVRAVSNEIRVGPRTKANVEDIAHRIERTLVGHAHVDAGRVRVTASDDGRVRLEGTVSSIAACRLAELAAESAPGVTKVIDDLDVTLPDDADVLL